MTNSDTAIREFAEKWGPTFTIEKGQYSDDKLIELCFSGLTSLISEHYVSKEEHEKLATATSGLMLSNKELLQEALTELLELFEKLHGKAIVGKTIRQKAEAAIKNTEKK